ncbi:MAG: UDP-N-acetylmuramoyl-L-alanyl-D-glutamate--2,6-diaminopimelate ligase [Bacilli bacterium]
MNIKIDSRKVKDGDTFIAIVGSLSDGHDFIEAAIKNGAKKIVAEYGSYSVETLIVKNTKTYLEKELTKYYKDITKDIKFVGITGTNGKTTTSSFIYQLLNSLSIKTSLIGTTGFYLNNNIKYLDNTTPDAVDLYYMIEECKNEDIKVIVLEISSHALVQNRVIGITLDVACFTNLTQDHLDYHKTMDEYLKAKLLILNKLKPSGKIIVNCDDAYSKYFCNGKEVCIGKDSKDFLIKKTDLQENITYVDFEYKNIIYKVTLNFNMLFNVYNYMIALAAVNMLGISIYDILSVSSLLYLPHGRCETILYKGNKIVVDYAHSPDAVLKVISNYKEICKGNIITVIGCTGSRDREKRPIMASLVTKLSDKVIFTDDDLHYEERESIENDMLKGDLINNYIFVYDRKNAIKKAINMLTTNDTLLILGMGHQDYTYVKDKKIPHNDINEVKKNLI